MDLIVIQKTIIDALNIEGKTQTINTEKAGCSERAWFKQTNEKMSIRSRFCNFERILKRTRFKYLGEIDKKYMLLKAELKIRSSISTVVYQKVLDDFLSADYLYGDAGFIFSLT